MSHSDDVFIRMFGAILGALVLFAIIAYIVAQNIASNALEAQQASDRSVRARISPVAQVRVLAPGEQPPAPPAPVVQAAAAPAATPAEAPAAAAKSGSEIYQGACFACHGTGAAGAPKVGDKAAWEPRTGQGLAALLQAAINGKNAMPPKGGAMHLSDDDVKAAVDYMLQETGVSAN